MNSAYGPLWFFLYIFLLKFGIYVISFSSCIWEDGFKLRVMRLNRVESFYAFLLHFRSKRSKEENGRPTTAKPLVGRPATAWPPARGQPAVAKTPCKGATGYGQGPLHKGRPAAASLQGRHPQGAARPRRGHKSSTRPRPARRGTVPAACAGATTAATQRGKRRT
ncbi:hypothetical protein BHE74_00047661 [Ensete ventricosum]|nr:hypothetical protein BHE74_00047661 [Ensete ventricosum]